MDFPLHAALVEVAEDSVERGPEVQGVEGEFLACCKRWLVFLAGLPGRERPQLNVFPLVALLILPKGPKQEFQVRFRIHQRLAMIRKRQGYHPAAPQPVLHRAKHNSVLQLFPRRSGRENDRLITISAVQRLEPSRRVENGGGGMAL